MLSVSTDFHSPPPTTTTTTSPPHPTLTHPPPQPSALILQSAGIIGQIPDLPFIQLQISPPRARVHRPTRCVVGRGRDLPVGRHLSVIRYEAFTAPPRRLFVWAGQRYVCGAERGWRWCQGSGTDLQDGSFRQSSRFDVKSSCSPLTWRLEATATEPPQPSPLPSAPSPRSPPVWKIAGSNCGTVLCWDLRINFPTSELLCCASLCLALPRSASFLASPPPKALTQGQPSRRGEGAVVGGSPRGTQGAEVELNGNNFTRINKNDFAGLKYLRVLQLMENQIGTIERGAFDDMKELERLRLNRNQLHQLPELLFQKNAGLSRLRSQTFKSLAQSLHSRSGFTAVSFRSFGPF
ncbi:hypothetical protein ACEWY4_020697 [Coilia grayii]|uniref:Uncharacterized protein n=1 Tax=Coilia grayii TaxID=363190 RepID=A0ABD1J6W5_9TELE